MSSNKTQVAFFDTKREMAVAFTKAVEKNNLPININFINEKLNEFTAGFAKGCEVVCIFVNDVCDATVIAQLKELGVKLIALRCAGFDNVDLKAAKEAGLSVTRVPAYSPHAVAEFAIGLMMTLNRKYHKAYNRTREFNFSLMGLTGFDMHGKTVGVIGTGKIGVCAIKILRGFGCHVIAYDIYPDPEVAKMEGVKYVTLDEVLAQSDIITLHAPLNKGTYHMINAESIGKMKDGVMLINTSRGALVDTPALLDALVSGKLGSAALDVYEQEKHFFFTDKSDDNIQDMILARLTSCHNVLITGHQAFLTDEALSAIAESTLDSCQEVASGKSMDQLKNWVKPQ